MKLGIIGGVVAVLLIVALIVGYSSVFTVYQTHQALVVRLGEPVRVVTEPGLHFKYPLIDSVISIDRRILDLENPAQEIIASDQKRLVVDAFARYRINNALRRLGSGWAIFVDAERVPAAGYPQSDFPEPLSWLVEEERRAAFEEDQSHFESAYHLTLVYLPPGYAQESTRLPVVYFLHAFGSGVRSSPRSAAAFLAACSRCAIT